MASFYLQFYPRFISHDIHQTPRGWGGGGGGAVPERLKHGMAGSPGTNCYGKLPLPSVVSQAMHTAFEDERLHAEMKDDLRPFPRGQEGVPDMLTLS